MSILRFAVVASLLLAGGSNLWGRIPPGLRDSLPPAPSGVRWWINASALSDGLWQSADAQSTVLRLDAGLSTPSFFSTADSSVESSNSAVPWYSYLANVPADWIGVWETSTSREGVQTLGLAAGSTLALMTADRPVWNSMHRWYHHSRSTLRWNSFFVSLGQGSSHLALAAGIAGAGVVLGDARALRTAGEIAESFLACGTVVQLLKHVSGRESPSAATSRNGRWSIMPNQGAYLHDVPKYDAFPSGHLATSMSTLTVIVENYPELKPWLQPLGYAVIGCVGVGLCSSGMHWWSDFPVGLYLGYRFGMAASHRPKPGEEKPELSTLSRFSVAPLITSRADGITFLYHLQ